MKSIAQQPHKYRCKTPKQNISKLNSATYENDKTLQKALFHKYKIELIENLNNLPH